MSCFGNVFQVPFRNMDKKCHEENMKKNRIKNQKRVCVQTGPFFLIPVNLKDIYILLFFVFPKEHVTIRKPHPLPETFYACSKTIQQHPGH